MQLTASQRNAVSIEDRDPYLSRLCTAPFQCKSVNLALIPQSQVL